MGFARSLLVVIVVVSVGFAAADPSSSSSSHKVGSLPDESQCVDLCVLSQAHLEKSFCAWCDEAYGKVLNEIREDMKKLHPKEDGKAQQQHMIEAEALQASKLLAHNSKATKEEGDAIRALFAKEAELDKEIAQSRSKSGLQGKSTFAELAEHVRRRRSSFAMSAASPNSPSKKWPKGIIPYKLQNAFSPKLLLAFSKVVKTVTKNTCLYFKQDQLNANAVSIEKSPNAGSFTDGLGTTCTKLALADPGVNVAVDENTLQHEVGHLVGLMHTHQRSDRAPYVTFENAACGGGPTLAEDPLSLLGNANFGTRYQFFSGAVLAALTAAGTIAGMGDVADVGNVYSYDSVMHYRFETCMSQPLGAVGVPAWMNDWSIPHPNWSAYDDTIVNTMYSCSKTTITYKGATFDQYVNLAGSLELYQDMIYHKTGVQPSKQILTKADNTVVAGNDQKPVSTFGIAANAAITLTVKP